MKNFSVEDPSTGAARKDHTAAQFAALISQTHGSADILAKTVSILPRQLEK
jgi:hypothetical protein